MSERNAVDRETEFLFSLVKARYGGYLSADQLSEVRDDVASLVEAAASLRAVKLENSDAPFLMCLPQLDDRDRDA